MGEREIVEQNMRLTVWLRDIVTGHTVYSNETIDKGHPFRFSFLNAKQAPKLL